MWALLIPILSQFGGAIGNYFKQLNDIESQKLTNLAALEIERGKLIAQGIISDSELGQAQLKATSAIFKQLIYTLMLSPIIINCFSPEQGAAIFHSLNMVPEWYMGMIVTIGLAIWGINSDKLAGIVQARRDYKLAKIDRKAYYDALRKTKGTVTQDDLKEGEAVFNELDKEQ